MEHLVHYGGVYLCRTHFGVCCYAIDAVGGVLLLEVGIKLPCVYGPGCAVLVVDLKVKEWLARVLALHRARYKRVLSVYHQRLNRDTCSRSF